MPKKNSKNILNKNIFIEGERFVGKSELILEIMKELDLSFGGFMSIRILGEKGENQGFYLEYAKDITKTSISASDDCIDKDRLIMTGDADNRKIQISAFSTAIDVFAVDNQDCFVMDEIGGIELLSNEFTNHINNKLNSNIICIGTIKSDDNFLHMQRKLGVDTTEIALKREELKEKITILTLTKENRNEIKKQFVKAVERKPNHEKE